MNGLHPLLCLTAPHASLLLLHQHKQYSHGVELLKNTSAVISILQEQPKPAHAQRARVRTLNTFCTTATKEETALVDLVGRTQYDTLLAEVKAAIVAAGATVGTSASAGAGASTSTPKRARQKRGRTRSASNASSSSYKRSRR